MIITNRNLLKKQEVREILSSLGIKTPLSKSPLLNNTLFLR